MQWNPGQSWQAGAANGPNNPHPPNPALPATPGVRPPFVRNPGPNNPTPGPQPPAQLNASDTLKALEPSPDKSTDPNAQLKDPAPEDEEALQANRFRSTDRPWIDIPLDVQEQRQKEGACILCGERGHFIGECPKRPAMGHAIWTFEGKECEYQNDIVSSSQYQPSAHGYNSRHTCTVPTLTPTHSPLTSTPAPNLTPSIDDAPPPMNPPPPKNARASAPLHDPKKQQPKKPQRYHNSAQQLRDLSL
ncbi:hypothetical protein C0992_010487 [Termitomyces sp. T32_za158]|nr:hypothetical protein C0992_010487 [Termitomyces sp. T32_za158]